MGQGTSQRGGGWWTGRRAYEQQPLRQIEIAATEKAELEARYAATARFFLACEYADAEGEAY